MTERPILFSGPMVKALLGGRKSQTRRVIRSKHHFMPTLGSCFPSVRWLFNVANGEFAYAPTDDPEWKFPIRCPYGKPGDRLWVRETLRLKADGPVMWPVYAADGKWVKSGILRADPQHLPFRNGVCPTIHMPRRVSRITLEITDVRVQRVQEIGEEDAIAEGLVTWSDPPRMPKTHYGIQHPDVWETDPRLTYKRLWDSINAKRGFGWEVNPWVWAITFKRIETSNAKG